MTTRRHLPASDPAHRLRIVAAVLGAILALLLPSTLAPLAGASVHAAPAPAEQRTESILDPSSAEAAAPEQRTRSRAATGQSRRRSTHLAPRARLGPPASSCVEGPVTSHVPALVPPGRAPPSHSA